MNLQDWMKSAADFLGPGAAHAPIVRHDAIHMPTARTKPKKHFSLHKKPQGIGHENIRADASPSDFTNTHLWEEPSASDTTARAWHEKRKVEKVKRRNLELFEVSASADGPCGCTLKVGEKVIVEGIGKGKILSRNHRILTIRSAGGQQGQFDQNFVHHLYGVGTSEGAKKGWELRDRRNITEYAPGLPGKGTKTTYQSTEKPWPNAGKNVYVTETKRRAKVEEHGSDEWGNSFLHRVHDGTPESARKFLKEKYGIEHGK